MNRAIVLFWVVLNLAFVAPGAEALERRVQPKQTLGASGNPIPRFIAIRDETAMMRTGPGTNYPIRWVYKRSRLPVEVIAEFGAWREVRDSEGATGWMLGGLFIRGGDRFVMIRGKTRTLYQEKSLDSPVSITAEAGVIGLLISCEDIWCEIKISDREAWIERRHLWGVYKNEVLE